MNAFRVVRSSPFCLVAVVTAVAIGCGPSGQVLKDRASVSGTVTFDGKPLPAGTIVFESTEGPNSTPVSIYEGGRYSTNRAPIGKNAVTVDTSSIQYGNAAKHVPIPEKYGFANTSGLTADIQPGENENVNFTLEKE